MLRQTRFLASRLLQNQANSLQVLSRFKVARLFSQSIPQTSSSQPGPFDDNHNEEDDFLLDDIEMEAETKMKPKGDMLQRDSPQANPQSPNSKYDMNIWAKSVIQRSQKLMRNLEDQGNVDLCLEYAATICAESFFVEWGIGHSDIAIRNSTRHNFQGIIKSILDHTLSDKQLEKLLDIVALQRSKNLAVTYNRARIITYASNHFDQLSRVIFEKGNYRFLSYFIYVENAAIKNMAVDPNEIEVRNKIVDELINQGMSFCKQDADKIRLLEAIMNSAKNLDPTQKELDFCYKAVAQLLKTVKDPPEYLQLMIAISCSPKLLLPSELAVMDAKFESLLIKQSNSVIASDILSDSENTLLSNFLSFSRLFNESSNRLLVLLRGKLHSRPAYFRQFLGSQDLLTNPKILSYVNSEIQHMLTLEARLSPISRVNYFKLGCYSIFKMSSNRAFNDFDLRDSLYRFCIRLMKQIPADDIHLRSINHLVSTQVAWRRTEAILFKEIADKIIDVLNVKNTHHKTDDLTSLLLSMLYTETDIKHPVINAICSHLIQKDNLPRIAVFEAVFKNLCGVCVILYVKSMIIPAPKDRFRVRYLDDFVKLTRQTFKQLMDNKTQLRVNTLHRAASFYELLVAFGYYDGSPLKPFAQATADKILLAIKDTFVRTGSTFFKSKETAKDYSREAVAMQVLKDMNINYERDATITLYSVDFLLPEYKTIIELNGAYHYSRKAVQGLLKDDIKNLYLEKLGYRVLIFDTVQQVKNNAFVYEFTRFVKDNVLEGRKQEPRTNVKSLGGESSEGSGDKLKESGSRPEGQQMMPDQARSISRPHQTTIEAVKARSTLPKARSAEDFIISQEPKDETKDEPKDEPKTELKTEPKKRGRPKVAKEQDRA